MGCFKYEDQNNIQIVDVDLATIKKFIEQFSELYKDIIHSGEKETLAFLCSSSDNLRVCASDQAVFRTLGLLGKSEQGISLEEVLARIGLSQSKYCWRYTKQFREKYTLLGQVDFIHDNGF